MSPTQTTNRRFSTASVLGIVTLFGISFVMMRFAIFESDARQDTIEHMGAYGFLLFLGTLGGTAGYVIAGVRGVVWGIITTMLVGFFALVAIFRHFNL